MRVRQPLAWLCGAALFFFVPGRLPAALAAETHTSVPSAPSLTVQPDKNALTGTPGYDFAPVSVLSSAQLVHVFTLRNTSPVPVTLLHLQTSCGCTSATLGKDGAQKAPVTIPAGGTAELHVSIDPSHLTPGPISKKVWVYTDQQGAPLALDLTGTLRPAATFLPETLDFGRVPAGEAHPLLLTVYVDPLLASQGAHLAASDANFQITLVPQKGKSGQGDKNTGAKGQKAALETAGAAKGTVQVYAISIAAHPHLGVLNGALSLVPDKILTDSRAFAGSDVLVTGEVMGDMAAAPATIAFGMVPKGQAAAEQVLLSGPAASAQALKVVCGSPYLSAHVEATGKPHSLILKVALSPTMPPGSLETQVIVTQADGLQLVLPASVFVSTTAGSR